MPPRLTSKPLPRQPLNADQPLDEDARAPLDASATENRSGTDLARIYVKYRPIIFRYLVRRTGDPGRAEELTQEVFLALLEGGLPADRTRSLLPWLYTIALRRYVDDARNGVIAGRCRCVTLDETFGLQQGDAAALDGLSRTLVEAISSLPPTQRRIFLECVVRGRSVRELSLELGLSECACKMRLQRGVRMVRTSLRQAGLGEPRDCISRVLS